MIRINNKEYLTESEASKFLGKGEGWLAVRRSRELDHPRCYKFGKRRVYTIEELNRWWNNRINTEDEND